MQIRCKQSITWPASSDKERLWLEEASQVIVVVPQLLFLQTVTQLERCDEVNMLREARKDGGGS